VRGTKVNAGLAESNGRLLLGLWRDSLHVTCGLTACTPGSAPGQTLGNEYGKTSPFYRVLSGLRQSGRRDLERRVSGCALVCISSRYYQSTDNSTQSRTTARLDGSGWSKSWSCTENKSDGPAFSDHQTFTPITIYHRISPQRGKCPESPPPGGLGMEGRRPWLMSASMSMWS